MVTNYLVQEDGSSRLRVEENMGNDFILLEEAQQEWGLPGNGL